MEVASTKATLVDGRELSDGVTATIPRAEFEAALASEEPAELFLEVTQPEGEAEGEKHDVSVRWSRADLERLLAETSGSAITLAFDRKEVERLLAGRDVEAHGFREKALALTVAAATATAGASTAAAAAHDEAGLTARGVTPSYVAVHDEATLAARGIEATPLVSSHDEATLAARGIEATPLVSSHDEATLAARGIEATPVVSTHDEATLASRGVEPAATRDEATLAARGIEPGTVPATHDEATLAARGIEPAAPPAAEGWAVDVPVPDATTAATAGGLAGLGLLITAAGFAVRRRRSVRPA